MSKWFIGLTILAVVAAIGLTVLAQNVDLQEQERLNSYNLDYSDKIIANNEDFEQKTFEIKINKVIEKVDSSTEENTIEEKDTEDDSTENNETIESDNKDIIQSKLLKFLGTSKSLETLCKYDSWYSNYPGTVLGYSIPELSYDNLKELGIEHGDIITLHYDEDALEEKGSQDIDKIVIRYDYIKTVDKLNGNEDEIEESGTVTSLISYENYESKQYIINRIIQKAKNNEDYTIEIEKTHHVVDYDLHIIKEATKEY